MEEKICVHCGENVEEKGEFDRGRDKKSNRIYMCEECLDYSGYTITYYENKNCTRRLNKFKKGA